MTRLPYQETGPIGAEAVLGLIALQTDETIEPELQDILRGEGRALYVTRVPSGAAVTPATLAAMEADLPAAAALLPPSLDFDVVGYGCTSGATTIGAGAVADIVAAGATTRAVTDPLTAVIAAARALDVRKIGFVTPYLPEVSASMSKALELADLEIAAFGSFEEPNEARVARISPASVKDAAMTVGGGGAEAVFLSCTNLRTLPVIVEIEAALGKPVISSNQALAWHMLRVAGLDRAAGPGRLFQCQLNCAA